MISEAEYLELKGQYDQEVAQREAQKSLLETEIQRLMTKVSRLSDLKWNEVKKISALNVKFENAVAPNPDKWYKWVNPQGRPAVVSARLRGDITQFDLRDVGKRSQKYEHVGPLVICKKGLHASQYPFAVPGANSYNRLFEVEVSDEKIAATGHRKVVFRWVRFLREIDKTSYEYELLKKVKY